MDRASSEMACVPPGRKASVNVKPVALSTKIGKIEVDKARKSVRVLVIERRPGPGNINRGVNVAVVGGVGYGVATAPTIYSAFRERLLAYRGTLEIFGNTRRTLTGVSLTPALTPGPVITKENADSFDLNKYMQGRNPS